MRETWDVRLRARGVGRVLRQVTFALAVAAGALGAQNSPSLLDRPARLDVENVTIEVALRTLRRSSGVALAYSPDLLPEGRRVTCRCDKLTVGQALDRLLAEEEIDYTIELVKSKIGKLRDLSPLWEMYKDGIDLNSVQWAAH